MIVFRFYERYKCKRMFLYAILMKILAESTVYHTLEKKIAYLPVIAF